MALPWVRNQPLYNAKVSRIDKISRASASDIFWMAYLDSFSTESKATSLGDAWVRSKEYKSGPFIPKEISEPPILSLFFGYNPIQNSNNSFPTRLWRTLGNVIKLFTEFPIRLVDYAVEALFERAYHVFKYNIEKKNGARIVVLGLLSFILAAIHIPLKITALLACLTISYNKSCQSAAAQGELMKLPWLGTATRILGVGLRVGLCFAMPFAFPGVLTSLGSIILASSVGSETVASGVASHLMKKAQKQKAAEGSSIIPDGDEYEKSSSSDFLILGNLYTGETIQTSVSDVHDTEILPNKKTVESSKLMSEIDASPEQIDDSPINPRTRSL